jgi:hypothetical protein
MDKTIDIMFFLIYNETNKINIRTKGITKMQKNIKLTGLAVGFLALGLVAFPSVAAADPPQETGVTTVNVQVGSTITLSGASAAVVNITPALGSTGTSVQTLSVTTNSSSGYQLKIEMNDANKNLVYSINNITPTTNGTSAAVLQNDSWGYNFSDSSPVAATTFLTIPNKGAPTTIRSENAGATAQATYVTFGALPTANLPSGTYTGQVLYTAVANS